MDCKCGNKTEGGCRHGAACRNHGVKCPSCGKFSCAVCILEAAKDRIACPSCKKPLLLCPTCLKTGKIGRLKVADLSCSCGFKLK